MIKSPHIKPDNYGFSLVELIVVVLIIGILGVTLTPKIIQWTEKARIASDRNSLVMVREAVNLAYTNSEIYSSALDKTIKITVTDDISTTKIEADASIKTSSGKSFATVFEENAGGPITDFVFQKVHKAVLVYENGILLPPDSSDTEIPSEFTNDLSED